MNKLAWFFALLLCSISAYGQNQNFENIIISDFEKEFYRSSKAVILDYHFVDSHALQLSGEFLQIFIAKSTSIGGDTPVRKSLVISTSDRKEFLGIYDYIDPDEVDDLIEALEYYLTNLSGSKPKHHQSLLWTSSGGFQIQATCSMNFPRKYNLSFKIFHLNAGTSSAFIYDKQIEKLIVSLKAAKKML